MVRRTFLTAALASLLIAAGVFAQQDQSGQARQAAGQQGSGGQPTPDTNFMKMAAVDNLFEIQVSQLAQQKAQDQKVKQFAEMMVQDHTKASNELKQLAQGKGVQLPQQLPELKQEELQIFQSLSGSEFDQEYKSCMKVAHAKDVAKFEEKAKHAKDQEVKAWAAKTLPKLKEHKQHIMAMTGGGDSDDAQPAGSRQRSESGASGSSGTSGSGSGSSGSSGTGTSSSGSGSRETGSGTTSGGGTTGAGSPGGRTGGQ